MKTNLRLVKVCAVAGLTLSAAITDNAFAASAARVANATALHANFQQKEIHGTVKDAKGSILPGVTVMIKGSAKGTQTDVNGQFKLAAKAGDVLVFRFVGYGSQEITVGSSDEVNVALEEGATGLNELVVTALGIKREEKSIGYAMTKVKGSEFTQAREINVANALVGKVAGVNSTAPSTGAGGSSRVSIRGTVSVAGTVQPLYVVNGVPYNNTNMGNPGKYGGSDMGDGMASINPDDIEDITVLKGGPAAALYGSRGLGGVILITTKSGKARKGLGVEVNSNFTIDKVHDFRDFQDQYGQGTQGAKPTDAGGAKATGLSSWGAKLDGSTTPLFNGTNSPYANVADDHFKDFYRTGNTISNTVAISGGNEMASFRLSLGDLRNQGVYPNSYYKRNNVALDLNYKLSDKFSGGVNIIYSKERANRSNVSDAPANGNFAIMFLPNNVPAKSLAPGWDPLTDFETEFNANQYNTNPYFAAAKATNLTNKNRTTATGTLKYQATDWLFFQGRLSNDNYSFNSVSIWPYGIAFKHDGKLLGDQTNTFNELNAELMAGINKKLGSHFNVSANVGGNFMKQDVKNIGMNADGLAYKNVYSPATGSSVVPSLTTPNKEIQSVYASAELSYKNMLFLNLTDRNDWSSTLPNGKNSYNYPSASVSYLLSETIKTDWLSLAKIRAGYSKVGGDAEPQKTQLYYATLAGASINGAPIGSMPTEIPNKALEPLMATEYEVGTQLSFLRNRVSVDFAWYKRATNNDIVASSISYTSGYDKKYVNLGKIENTGIELLVAVTPVKTNNFSWTTTVNFTNNKNTVVQLTDGQPDLQMDESRTERAYVKQAVGLPAFQITGFDYLRDDKGNLILDNGLPQAGNLKYLGTAVAPITGGWSNEFNYKRFGLSFLIDFKDGAVMYSGTNSTAYSLGLHKETLPGRETGITVTGVDATGKAVSVQKDAQTYYARLATISALQVYDADFIKFRSLSLTYNFPASAFKNKIGGLSLSLVGRNLFYIKKNVPNIDPESFYTSGVGQGLEYAGVPTSASYGLNLNVKF
ncbi:SusC/RagA family TonB-linked outer membrane protein [Chitinophaga sp. sic0106]|uniref:SusC/RagA family TonB-linked outer membrane protein n=1 Tax=Chitinophaga sp. sic0106 TaxID=2854785 RepID=UPI001C48F0FD|nr:SusC/RagA family TonB-linked outer membrane protein [Chitinophaga sp. sic0106]MBV7531901.1 SusC/RagA family TonB-linked outer membrane protein [Chitinophaga sp. sic0106]